MSVFEGKLAGYKFKGGTAPTDGQTWVWDATNKYWKPGTSMAAHATVQAQGSGVLGAVYEAVLNLTNAQITALFTTKVEIIPAPGANLWIFPIRWAIMLDSSGGAYAGGGNTNLFWGTDYASGGVSPNLFTGTAGTRIGTGLGTATPLAASVMSNVAVTVGTQTANFTGGNAANKATVRVIYSVLSTLAN